MSKRSVRVALLSCAAFVVLISDAIPAQAEIIWTDSYVGSCTRQYSTSGQQAAPEAGWTSRVGFHWWPNGNSKDVSTGVGANEHNYGSAGVECNAAQANARAYEIKVWAVYEFSVHVHNCDAVINWDYPPSVNVGAIFCTGGYKTRIFTHVFDCKNTVHQCGSDLGGITVTLTDDRDFIAGVSRRVDIKLWKTSRATPYSYSTKKCTLSGVDRMIRCF